jgi:hypothetical protein
MRSVVVAAQLRMQPTAAHVIMSAAEADASRDADSLKWIA